MSLNELHFCACSQRVFTACNITYSADRWARCCDGVATAFVFAIKSSSSSATYASAASLSSHTIVRNSCATFTSCCGNGSMHRFAARHQRHQQVQHLAAASPQCQALLQPCRCLTADRPRLPHPMVPIWHNIRYIHRVFKYVCIKLDTFCFCGFLLFCVEIQHPSRVKTAPATHRV